MFGVWNIYIYMSKVQFSQCQNLKSTGLGICHFASTRGCKIPHLRPCIHQYKEKSARDVTEMAPKVQKKIYLTIVVHQTTNALLSSRKLSSLKLRDSSQFTKTNRNPVGFERFFFGHITFCLSSIYVYNGEYTKLKQGTLLCPRGACQTHNEDVALVTHRLLQLTHQKWSDNFPHRGPPVTTPPGFDAPC